MDGKQRFGIRLSRHRDKIHGSEKLIHIIKIIILMLPLPVFIIATVFMVSEYVTFKMLMKIVGWVAAGIFFSALFSLGHDRIEEL